MTPEQYERETALIMLSLRAVLTPLLRLLPPRPTAEQWDALVAAAYPAVYRARVDAWRASERFYRAERYRRLGVDDPVLFPRRNYPPEALAKALHQQVKPRLDLLDDDEPVPTVIIEEAVAVAERHAQEAGRQAVIDAARHDDRAIGYARRLVGAVNCAFCSMLASRGPVYRSAESALIRHEGRGRNAVPTGEPFHNRCNCQVVPVYNRDDWPGRDQYLELQRAWREHANGNLADWRRYLASRTKQPASEQPASEQAA